MTQSAASSHDRALLTGKTAILARRYAGALYELAAAEKQLEAVAADMRLLNDLAQQSAELAQLAASPSLTTTQRAEVVQKMAASAKMNALTTNFLNVAARNGRLGMIGALARTFLDRYAAERGEHVIDVIAARPLSAAQQEKLSAVLKGIVGGTVHLALRHDPDLMGGLIVKLGSQVIDASVKSKLDRLERQLKTEQTFTQKGAA